MQNIIITEPYQFVPPYRSRFWLHVFRFIIKGYLRRTWGLEAYEIRGTEKLRQSLDQNHGIILAPNHSRPFDPIAIGLLGLAVDQPFYTMASWHLFKESRFKAWLIRRVGAFSVYREGTDRESIRTATEILVNAERPIVILPEGVVTRTNDRLGVLQEGVAFIARTAAKQRARSVPPGKVVVHPLALKYFFQGDVQSTVGPVLERIENRLALRLGSDLPLLARVCRVGLVLLSLKEIDYLGAVQEGTLAQRLNGLVECILQPLEKEWLNGQTRGSPLERLRRLRSAIVPGMSAGDMSEVEKTRRWEHLRDLYLVQQLYCYPPEYLDGQPSAERILETIERFEEDLEDVAQVHRPLRLVMEVGDAIDIDPDRKKHEVHDTIMSRLESSLKSMLQDLDRTARAVST